MPAESSCFVFFSSYSIFLFCCKIESFNLNFENSQSFSLIQNWNLFYVHLKLVNLAWTEHEFLSFTDTNKKIHAILEDFIVLTLRALSLSRPFKNVSFIAWNVFKYGVISGPYFSVFGLNTEIYFVNLRIQSPYSFSSSKNI